MALASYSSSSRVPLLSPQPVSCVSTADPSLTSRYLVQDRCRESEVVSTTDSRRSTAVGCPLYLAQSWPPTVSTEAKRPTQTRRGSEEGPTSLVLTSCRFLRHWNSHTPRIRRLTNMSLKIFTQQPNVHLPIAKRLSRSSRHGKPQRCQRIGPRARDRAP